MILKDIAIIIGESLLVTLVGLVLSLLNFHSSINLIIFILLLFEIIWLLKFSYNKSNVSPKKIAVLSFVILAICFVAVVIIKSNGTIPFAISTSCLYLMGYLSCNGCLNLSKCQTFKSKALMYKIKGVFFFVFSIIMGILALFGLAK